MLALAPNGLYRLLFCKIDHRSLVRTNVRGYAGHYALTHTEMGDAHVTLDIRLRSDSSGSDANDAPLVVMRSGTDIFLLRTDELASMATAMDASKTLGRSDNYLRKVVLRDAFADELSGGRTTHRAPIFHARCSNGRLPKRSSPPLPMWTTSTPTLKTTAPAPSCARWTEARAMGCA